MDRLIFDEDHHAFRRLVRQFVKAEMEPHFSKWDAAGVVDPHVWRLAGELGILAPDIAKIYGGGGRRDYRYHVIRGEEMARVGTLSPAFNLHSEVAAGYLDLLGTDEQKERWLPGICSGRTIATVAVTEAGAGSDVAAIRTVAHPVDGGYLLSGQKSFVTHGSIADVILVVARSDGPARGSGGPAASLFVLEPTMPGIRRGRPVAKIGLRSLDTIDVFFDEVQVPSENVLGHPGLAFLYLLQNLPRERLSIAVTALALADKVLTDTATYCRQPSAVGPRLNELQHVRFELAEMITAVAVAREFTDRCIVEHDQERLGAEEAAMAKWWNTDLCNDVVNRCLQLYGAHADEGGHSIARICLDVRVQTIYGGTSEIMKEIIGQSLAF